MQEGARIASAYELYPLHTLFSGRQVRKDSRERRCLPRQSRRAVHIADSQPPRAPFPARAQDTANYGAGTLGLGGGGASPAPVGGVGTRIETALEWHPDAPTNGAFHHNPIFDPREGAEALASRHETSATDDRTHPPLLDARGG